MYGSRIAFGRENLDDKGYLEIYTSWLKRCYRALKAGDPNGLAVLDSRYPGGREDVRDYSFKKYPGYDYKPQPVD